MDSWRRAESKSQGPPREAARVRVLLGSSPARPSAAEWVSLVAIVATAVAADQLSKRIAEAELALGEKVQVLPFLALAHTRNDGIAFGLFEGRRALILPAVVIALAALVLLFRTLSPRSPLLPVAFGLLIGGAATNGIDRTSPGYVTDILAVPRWPVFNLADVFICVGAGLLMLVLLRSTPSARAA